MWTVWFYTPSNGRKFIDRFNTRGEAESYGGKLRRLVNLPIVVCFEQPL
ncbi:MAG TPA: hypothetical protein V6C84_27330 [Coleofasciculaceae cyanobacterium]|jgi:hypothetical protein